MHAMALPGIRRSVPPNFAGVLEHTEAVGPTKSSFRKYRRAYWPSLEQIRRWLPCVTATVHTHVSGVGDWVGSLTCRCAASETVSGIILACNGLFAVLLDSLLSSTARGESPWIPQVCTLWNEFKSIVCDACETLKPDLTEWVYPECSTKCGASSIRR